MVSWLPKTSPENQGAFLLVLGVAIFGFADNLTLMVSDQVGVGQFHFSRSIITLALVVIFSHIFGYSLRPKLWRPLLARTGFIVFAMLIYFSVIPMMPIAEAGAGLCSFHWNNRCFTYYTAWIRRFFHLSFVTSFVWSFLCSRFNHYIPIPL